MSKEEFKNELSKALVLIDRNLARGGVRVNNRPIQAATDYVKFFITAVQVGDEISFTDNDDPKNWFNSDWLHSVWAADWFKELYSEVWEWYVNRYPDAFNKNGSGIKGLVLISNTPFPLIIPRTVSRPAIPGKTSYLQFPDHIVEGENPVDWVVGLPNLTKEELALEDIEKRVSEIAINLRVIATAPIPEKSSREFDNFKSGILSNLERAADIIVNGGQDSLKRAHWDLQMALESALKALAIQEIGNFKSSHDLFYLFDEIPFETHKFNRSELKKFPRWEQMAEFRYGKGKEVGLAEVYELYLAALQICADITSAFKGIHVGKGRMEIKKAPFLK